MNAYRIPGRAEIEDVVGEARRDAKRMRLEERLRFIDALIGSPERRAATGTVSASAAFGGPFVVIGMMIWSYDTSASWWSTSWRVGLVFVGFGVAVSSTWTALFRAARFFTRRSLAKLP